MLDTHSESAVTPEIKFARQLFRKDFEPTSTQCGGKKDSQAFYNMVKNSETIRLEPFR